MAAPSAQIASTATCRWINRLRSKGRSPVVQETEDRRVRGVRAIGVPEHERARLHDAVDHAWVEGKVEDPIRLVYVRHRRGQPPVQAMTHVEAEILQLVERLRE